MGVITHKIIVCVLFFTSKAKLIENNKILQIENMHFIHLSTQTMQV